MPIYLDRELSNHNFRAGDKGLRAKPPVAFHASAAHCLDIGLINNMPDGALTATERQFIRLLGSVADRVVVRLSFYALPEIPRTDAGRRRIAQFYSSIGDLWNRHLDGLIVTGTEPHASTLEEEPYWANLTKVLEWAEHNTGSAVWSCLAAHAAVLHKDGIRRQRLSEKRFGVFRCTRVSDHPLLAGTRSQFAMPHSRWNDIREDELKEAGYRVLARGQGAGADTFAKQGKSLFVFFQGHPEYEARTLLLEYRRDLRRYLRRENDHYPPNPQSYFDPETEDMLAKLKERAVRDRREELFADFPAAINERNLATPWRSTAARIYSNWLQYLSARKGQLPKRRQSRRPPARERQSTIKQRAAAAD